MRRGPDGKGGGAAAAELEQKLEDAARALEEERPEDALALVAFVKAKDPGNIDALILEAFAHSDVGDQDRAREVFQGALKKAPDDVELIFFAAEFLINAFSEDREVLEEAVALCRRGVKVAKKDDDVETIHDFLLLEGTALNQVGACEEALVRIDEAIAIAPGSVTGQVERGLALFELCRFKEAKAALNRANELCRQTGEEEDAHAHHFLGLIAEREGDEAEAKKRFSKAQKLASEDFAPPVTLSEEEFDAAVEAAVAKLPSPVKEYLDNATIAVEPFPPLEDLTAEKPPLSPAILGLFRGLPVNERNSQASGVDLLPPSIVLYQRNLERFARTKEELIEQIGITVMHEVGHLIGLDEDDLYERGLD